MALSLSAAKGTATLSAAPTLLESVYAFSTFGAISVYDWDGVTGSIPGTAVWTYTPAGTGDIGIGQHIDLPLTQGLTIVAGTVTQRTIVYYPGGRGR
jgi:hypothetical protein